MKRKDFYAEFLVDCKNVSFPQTENQSSDEDKFIPAGREELLLTLRLLEDTRNEINSIKETINSIAHFVGMPHKLKKISLCYYPAFVDGAHRACTGYIGYSVDLTPYCRDFSFVRFEACAPLHDDKLARACIIDDKGKVESVLNEEDCMCGNRSSLPITFKSRELIATLPLSKDKVPLFTPRYVELIPNGISHKLCEVKDRVGHLSTFVGFPLKN